ncbi:hypothetical protein N8083_01730 [Candidatus Pacebacteria bacterium]|nr:hypothetical protein [Candidatus Paceibacterota bacterium]
MIHIKQQQNIGFALLLTLIVVSVVLAIGLSLLDITLKQLILSGVGRDSEISFHAAYAGAECAQYYRLHNESQYLNSGGSMSNGDAAPALGWCLGGTLESSEYNQDVANVHHSEYQITWGEVGALRCTEMEIYLYDAVTPDAIVSHDITYYGSGAETCGAGKICTFLVSRGFNRECAETASIRTVQREIILKY